MAAPKKSTETKPDVKAEEPKRKSQKVKILVSVYRYAEKIISAHGISERNSWVKHIINKNKMKAEELFWLSKAISNDSFYSKDPDYKGTIAQILDASIDNVVLPERKASQLKNIGNFVHEILHIEIELFTT